VIMNYQLEMEKELGRLAAAGEKPRLLLHCCCAPCASQVICVLREYFDLTLFFFNPNIFPEEEHNRRLAELERLVLEMPEAADIKLLSRRCEAPCFYTAVSGLEDTREGGARCAACYALRLEETAKTAREMNIPYFTTTLSISPHKNAAKLNETGQRLAEQYGIKYLPSDFKKKDGYKKSLALSAEYGLYRQEYCGCKFSMKNG
jgi:predicted adenine nucleotide alpha hydrolase (AANH) superfamily ATPase